MANADGAVVIQVDVEVKPAHKRLVSLNREISKTQKTVDELDAKKTPLVQQAQELEVKMRQARAEAEKYNREWMAGVVGADKSESAARERAAQLEEEHRKVVAQIDKIDAKLIPAVSALERAKNEAGELEQNLASAPGQVEAMNAAYKKADNTVKEFLVRLKRVITGALVFSVVTKVLTSFRDWMGEVIKTNDEAVKAMGRLKGSLLTLVQPLLNIVVPAFTALVNILSRAVNAISSVLAGVFGVTIDQSAKSAEGLYNETEALEEAGAAAKKAGKSLATFDEINQLSSNSASGGGKTEQKITPIFEFGKIPTIFDTLSNKAKEIADDIKRIFSGVREFFDGLFHGDADKMFDGLVNAATGARDLVVDVLEFLDIFVSEIVDRIIEKFDLSGTWSGNALNGIKQAFHGLVDFISGILNGDLSRALSGVNDLFNGLKLTVVSVFDAIISFLPRPLVNIVTLIRDMFVTALDFAKEFFTGVLEFLWGVFVGDWKLAIKGAMNAAIALLNGFIGAFESVFRFIARAINGLIDTINAVIKSANEWLGTNWRGISWRATEPNWDRIPMLAQGAVIPPNREFLAVLGDQKSGNNIETPEALLRKIVREEAGQGANEQPVYLQIDGDTFAKFVYKYNQKETRRVGVHFLEL